MKFVPFAKFAAVAAALAISFSATAGAQTLRTFNGGEPASLDPHRVSGDWENRIVGDYLEGLMTEDANATPSLLGQASPFPMTV